MFLDNYISAINNAKNGRELRKPLIDVFRSINEDGKEAMTLQYKPDTYYLSKTEINKYLPLDSVPRQNSNKLVPSGSLFILIGDIDNLNLSMEV